MVNTMLLRKRIKDPMLFGWGLGEVYIKLSWIFSFPNQGSFNNERMLNMEGLVSGENEIPPYCHKEECWSLALRTVLGAGGRGWDSRTK